MEVFYLFKINFGSKHNGMMVWDIMMSIMTQVVSQIKTKLISYFTTQFVSLHLVI